MSTEAARLSSELRAIAQEVSEAVASGRPWEALRQRLVDTSDALSKALETQALEQARESAATLHKHWFVAEYRAAAALRELEKYAELQECAAAEDLRMSQVSKDQFTSSFYSHSTETRRQVAAALRNIHARCSSMTIPE